MRLRLWHRLFLALAALSVLALAGFAALQQQSFRRGFLGYLDEVALERLQPAAQRLAAAYQENGQAWTFLREDPRRFGEVVEPRGSRFGPRRAEEPPPRDDDAPAPPRDDARPAPRDNDTRPAPPPPHEGADDFPPHGPHGHGPPDLLPRLALFDAHGVRVAGSPDVPDDAHEVPVLLGATRIGSLRLARIPAISNAVDLDFARAQTRTALIAALAVLIGASLLAFALARWLLAPVRALAEGTRALAAGDYTRRIDATRADELGALAADFNHLAASLEQHREARRQWGADIAHELRTPLSVLRGEVQALQDGVRAPTAQAFDSLYAECERLGSLIEDLYQLALADAGALDYRFENLAPAELVREAIDLQRRACNDAGLSIEEAIDEVPRVRGDARRLAQLVDNLLANARRYTDVPGRIRVQLSLAGTAVRLLVEDTPPGVPAAHLPHLFDRLYRVERSRSRAGGGAGLGLAICHAIVAAHGGTIDAQPSPLGGLRVVIDLPIVTAEPA
ncbi:MAG: ATP-binding protein [Dokdonella sp.]